MHGSSSSRERLKDNFSDDDGLNGESWQKAQIKDDPFSLLDFLTKHMKALSVKAVKIGAAAVIGMLFLVILIVVMTVGGGCEDKEGSGLCEMRKSVGMCTSKNVLELTDMEWKCRKTCGLCHGETGQDYKTEYNGKTDMTEEDLESQYEEFALKYLARKKAAEEAAAKEPVCSYKPDKRSEEETVLNAHNYYRSKHKVTFK